MKFRKLLLMAVIVAVVVAPISIHYGDTSIGIATAAEIGTGSFSDDFEDGSISEYTEVVEVNEGSGIALTEATNSTSATGEWSGHLRARSDEGGTLETSVRLDSANITIDTDKNITFEWSYRESYTSSSLNCPDHDDDGFGQVQLWDDTTTRDGFGMVTGGNSITFRNDCIGHDWIIGGGLVSSSSATPESFGQSSFVEMKAEIAPNESLTLYQDGSQVATASLSGTFNEEVKISYRARAEGHNIWNQADIYADDVSLSQPADPSGGGSSSPTIEDHEQTFELVSHDLDRFPPTASDLTISRYVDEDGDPVKVGNPEQDPDTVEYVIGNSFNFRNQTTHRLDDDGFYRLEVTGRHGDVWRIDPFVADASGESLWPDPDDDGIVELEIFGPGGSVEEPAVTPTGTPTPFPTVTLPDGELPDYPDSWDPDGDGVIDNLPDMENPAFELPNSTLDQGPYLQTGLFVIGGERCAGVRYWDPTYSTDQFEYNFSIEGTQHEDTVTFDEEIGYYESCVDETKIDEDGTYGTDDTDVPDPLDTFNNSSFNVSGSAGSFDFGESFDFGGFGSGSGAGSGGGAGVLAPGGSGEGSGGGSGGGGLSGLLFLLGGLAAAVASRRYLPPEDAPDLPLIGTAPVSPLTLAIALVVIGLWATGNVPSIGPAIGFIGLIAFVWLDVIPRG